MFRDSYGVDTSTNNVVAVEKADMIILAIKPQSLQALAKSVASHVREDDLVISIMAGCTIDTLQRALQSAIVAWFFCNTLNDCLADATTWCAPCPTPQLWLARA
jgi:pyrroline-5-carboxylate reductase